LVLDLLESIGSVSVMVDVIDYFMLFIKVEITLVGKYKLKISGSPKTIDVDTTIYKDVDSHLFAKISSSRGSPREFV